MGEAGWKVERDAVTSLRPDRKRKNIWRELPAFVCLFIECFVCLFVFWLSVCLFIAFFSLSLFIHITAELTATWRPKSCQKAQPTIPAPIGSASAACCTNCSKAIHRSVSTRRKTSTRLTGWRWPWYYNHPVVQPCPIHPSSAVNTHTHIYTQQQQYMIAYCALRT